VGTLALTASPRGRRLAGPMLLLIAALLIALAAASTFGTATVFWRDVFAGDVTPQSRFSRVPPGGDALTKPGDGFRGSKRVPSS